MKSHLLFLFCILLSGNSLFADLAADYDFFLTNPSDFSNSQIMELNQAQYVWVGGFANEFLPGYFSENVKAMKDIGIENVFRIFPHSVKSIDSNSMTLKQKLLKLYEKNKLPLVVHAHSKAAAETLAMIILESDLISQGIVKYVVLHFGALGGAHLGDQMGSVIGPASRLIGGIHSLKSEQIDKAIRARINNLDPQVRHKISSRVFYVIGSKPHMQVNGKYRVLGRILEEDFGLKNDGLLAKSDMYLEGFGTVLADLIADHTELYLAARGISKSGTVEGKRAFTFALLKNSLSLPEPKYSPSTRDPIPTPGIRPPSLTRGQICLRFFQQVRKFSPPKI